MDINGLDNFIMTSLNTGSLQNKAPQNTAAPPLQMELSQLGQFLNTYVNYKGPQLSLDARSDSGVFSSPFPFTVSNGGNGVSSDPFPFASFNTSVSNTVPTTTPNNLGIQILQIPPLGSTNSSFTSTLNPVSTLGNSGQNLPAGTGFLGTSNGTSFFRNQNGTTSLLVERPITLYQAVRNLTDSAGILNANPANLGIMAPEEVVQKMISLLIQSNPILTGAQPGTVLPAQTTLNISSLYNDNGLMKSFASFLQAVLPLLTPVTSPPTQTPTGQVVGQITPFKGTFGFLGTINGSGVQRNSDKTVTITSTGGQSVSDLVKAWALSGNTLRDANPANFNIKEPLTPEQQQELNNMIQIVLAENGLTDPNTLLPAGASLQITALYNNDGIARQFSDFLTTTLPVQSVGSQQVTTSTTSNSQGSSNSQGVTAPAPPVPLSPPEKPQLQAIKPPPPPARPQPQAVKPPSAPSGPHGR